MLCHTTIQSLRRKKNQKKGGIAPTPYAGKQLGWPVKGGQ